MLLHDLIVELLECVSLESHEYVSEILPAIQQSYRDGSSKAQFRYTRPQLVHNSRLLDSVSAPYSVLLLSYQIRLFQIVIANVIAATLT